MSIAPTLTVVDNKYILRDNELAFTVQNPRYLEAIIETVSTIMLEKSIDIGFAVLGMMVTTLPEGTLRKPSDYDIFDFNCKRHTDERKKLLGERHNCPSCHKKFYDLHRELKCPMCHTPL